MKQTVITCDVCGCIIEQEGGIAHVHLAEHMQLDMCCGCSSDLARYVKASQKFGQDILHYLRIQFPGLLDGTSDVSGADLVESLTGIMQGM